MLAWEVQEKLLAQGVACNLVTGQELVQVDGATHISSTVEMADVVIDPCTSVVIAGVLLVRDGGTGAYTLTTGHRNRLCGD